MYVLLLIVSLIFQAHAVIDCFIIEEHIDSTSILSADSRNGAYLTSKHFAFNPDTGIKGAWVGNELRRPLVRGAFLENRSEIKDGFIYTMTENSLQIRLQDPKENVLLKCVMYCFDLETQQDTEFRGYAA